MENMFKEKNYIIVSPIMVRILKIQLFWNEIPLNFNLHVAIKKNNSTRAFTFTNMYV